MAMVGTICVLCLEQLLAYIAQRLAAPVPGARPAPSLVAVKGSTTVPPTLRRPSLDSLHDPLMCCDEKLCDEKPKVTGATVGACDIDNGGHNHADQWHGHSHGGIGKELGVGPLSHAHAAHASHVHKPAFSFVRAVVMDFSIAVHSVIIGLALGVNTHLTEIRVLIVALAFHQFFEGVGLGVVIAVATIATWQKTVLIVVFCLTTALGVAIGIGVEKRYAEDSSDHMYARGILNAFATGNLVYVALVEMIAEDMNTVAVQSSWRLKIAMVVSLCVGAAALAVLAIWA
jgi:zinc transporter 1/2/3